MFAKLMHRTAALAVIVAVAAGLFDVSPAKAGNDFPKKIYVRASDANVTRPLKVGMNRSVVIELNEDVRDVLVSSPGIADAVVRNARRVYVLGVSVGRANLFLFGVSGKQLASFDLSVEPDTGDLQRALRRVLPKSNIRAEAVNGSVVLSGQVASPIEAKRASDIANEFLSVPTGAATGGAAGDAAGGGAGGAGGAGKVINMITIAGKEQVHLRVTIAEVQRSIIKQLGVDLSTVGSAGKISINALTQNPFVVNGGPIAATASTLGYTNGATAIASTIRALQQDGVIRTLSEPTLTAISGESASFLVGGEFPIPVGRTDDTISIEFKKFGVSLDFVPVVMSEGNISLRIKTEVSELSNDGALNLVGAGLTIPALRVRRAETTVELPSGGSLVLAGLIKDDIRQSLNGIPGLMQLPVLGALFKSRDFQRSQTELVVFVTPYIVNPVAAAKLTRPDKNFTLPSDATGYFMNRLNRTYRLTGKNASNGKYYGRFGFIYE